MADIAPCINAVPANIITGFLGVGKTTAILQLVKNKPADERWAVLVNEFGEIGVDGSLIQGQYSEDNGVFIREVPGGCMCCLAGLPMQVALNQLLTKARPDRLLIEPTGLGHPKEVLQILGSGLYREVLKVQKILTLVNARHLLDERYTDNETFNQQISIADIVVANKADLYQSGDRERLQSYVKQNGNAAATVVFTTNGSLDTSFLDSETSSELPESHSTDPHHQNTNDNSALVSEIPLLSGGYLKAQNKGEGFHSVGWRFSADIVFKYDWLYNFLNGLEVERVKAVFVTDKGIYSYNGAEGSLAQREIPDCEESRIEIISGSMNNNWENQLLLCMRK